MRHTLLASVALAIGLAMAPAAFAEVVPAAGRHDNRVRNATYVDGQVYRVNVGMMRVTSIEFGPGEEISSIVAGDTSGFNFDGVPGGRAVVVKPTVAGGSTNMTVFTNRRAYYLDLHEVGRRADYVVRFGGGVAATGRKTGSQMPIKQVQRTAPYTLYGVSAKNDVTPLQVWDDGAFTYFRFRRAGQMPAIFKTSNGSERTVNSETTADGAVRVSGVSSYWVLRVGETETVVARMGAKQ